MYLCNPIRALVLLAILACCVASDFSEKFRAGLTESRVFGGFVASPGQFPYQISLRMQLNGVFAHNCGGSIISKRFIVTAGHCVLRKVPSADSYKIAVGSHERNGNATFYKVKKMYVHPEFDLKEIIHDIALFEVAEDIQFNENVTSISLEKEFINGSVLAVTSGWGRTNDKVTVLKYAYLRTVDNEECRILHETPAPIHDFSTLCAYSGVSGTGVCSGDSGGPLVHRGKLIGVTSWASLCALGVPDGFTRVSEYYDWIIDTMESAEQEFN